MILNAIKTKLLHFFHFTKRHNIHYIIYGVGFFQISYLFFRFCRLFYKSFLRPGKTLSYRYGSNSWVLLVGNLDDLGKAFCFELAEKGFNICLLSKNNYKLVKFSNEILYKYPTIKTKIIQANFEESLNKNFYTNIDNHLQLLDVSILINNVGLSKRCNSFEESSDEDLKDLLISNCFPIVFMTKRILNKMLQRNKNSAIINLSSQFWHFPGRSPLYCASRAFEIMFSESLTNEFHEKIDVLTYTPLYLSNPHHKFNEGNFWNINPKKAVDSCLKEIGYETKTYGHWKHKLMARWMQMLNEKGRRVYSKKMSQAIIS